MTRPAMPASRGRTTLLAVLAAIAVLLAAPPSPASATHTLTVGHRGDRLVGDNTWASIQSAFDLGADMVEIDVFYNPSGGTMFLAHDRQCAWGVYVDTSPAQTVRDTCGLPELGAVLSHFAAQGRTGFAIEVKDGPTVDGAALAVRSIVEARGLQHQVWVTAFNDAVLDGLRDSGTPIRLMRNKVPNLWGAVSTAYLDETAARGYDGVNIAIGDWDAATVAHARALGLTTSTWKLDVTGGFLEAENQQAIDLGLDWAMTDRVADMVAR